jgi:hypothetical protein
MSGMSVTDAGKCAPVAGAPCAKGAKGCPADPNNAYAINFDAGYASVSCYDFVPGESGRGKCGNYLGYADMSAGAKVNFWAALPLAYWCVCARVLLQSRRGGEVAGGELAPIVSRSSRFALTHPATRKKNQPQTKNKQIKRRAPPRPKTAYGNCDDCIKCKSWYDESNTVVDAVKAETMVSLPRMLCFAGGRGGGGSGAAVAAVVAYSFAQPQRSTHSHNFAPNLSPQPRCKITQNHSKSPKITQNHPKSLKIIQNHSKTPKCYKIRNKSGKGPTYTIQVGDSCGGNCPDPPGDNQAVATLNPTCDGPSGFDCARWAKAYVENPSTLPNVAYNNNGAYRCPNNQECKTATW